MEKIIIPDEVFYSMSPGKRMRLFFKINNKVFKIAVNRMKKRYPKLDVVSFSEKLYKHIDLERDLYDNLFNYFFKKELRI